MSNFYFKIKAFIAIVLFSVFVNNPSLDAQAVPKFEWAVQFGGIDQDDGLSVAVNKSGSNVFAAGSFGDSVVFDKVPLKSAGGVDVFVVRMDKTGRVIGAQQFGGTDDDYATSIAVDSQDNIYITGYFSGTATFGKQTFTSAGGTDIFLAKLDPKLNVQWAQQMGGAGDDQGNSVAVTSAGDVYVTGYFNAPQADFGKTTLTSTGVEDIFVAKLTTDGDYDWVTSYGGTGTDEGNAIAVDKDGNAAVTGIFNDRVVFVPRSKGSTSKGGSDIFVLKVTSDNKVSWARTMGGITDDGGTSVAFDPWGNVLTTGYFTDTADLDPSTFTANFSSSGKQDIFVSKLDEGGFYVWAKQMGGTNSDLSHGIATDAYGAVYTTGHFTSQPGDFDPGPGFDTLRGGTTPTFVSKLDSAGDFDWVRTWGDRTPGRVFVGAVSILSMANAITIDKDFNIYTTGHFLNIQKNKRTNLYPGPTTTGDSLMFTSNGKADIFVHKMSQEIKPPCTPTASSLTKETCDSFTLNGQTYLKSGTYTQTLKNVGGCDSVITLNLTVNKSTISSRAETACDSFTLNGQTYTASGHYEQFFSKGNATGCDSTLSIDLTINRSTTSYITEEACSSYTWGDSTYTQTGIYTQTLKTVTDCDSVVTLDLTVNTVDTTVEETGDHTLKATATGASYQWLDCDNNGTAITGAVSQSFTPNVDGDYSVVVTQGDCSDTSSCHSVEVPTGISDKNWSHSIQLYPNPVKEQLTVRSGVALDNASFRIVDVVGRVMIKSNKLSGKLFQVNVSGLVPGIYFIEINGSGTSYRIKFVKN